MLRFADEEDNEDLCNFVNESHRCECTPGSVFEFRCANTLRISLEEIDKDLNNTSLQWLILEEFKPTEMITGAVRYYTTIVDENNERKVIIDIFAPANDVDKNSIDTTICNRMINRIEHMTLEQNIDILEVHIPLWRNDLRDLLVECGYKDQGGHMWPSSDDLLKPTMIIHMRKKMISESYSNIEMLTDIEVVEGDGSRNGEMEELVSCLFTALHKEHKDNSGFEDL